ncbi:MAG: VWA domain-containing protein [Anaerolineae bacterium]
MRQNRQPRGRCLLLFLALFALVTSLPVVCWALFSRASRTVVPKQEATLRLAYSPEKEALFQQLLSEFERQQPKTSAGKDMRIELVAMLPEQMIKAALANEVQAVCPDSSLWLTAIDEAWQRETLRPGPLVGQTVRFAISPVVIAMRAEVARSMGYPSAAIGWTDILERARSDSSFGWSHASTSTASGLLATLAQFYAAAGKTRGLTVEDATSEHTLAYVAAIESTVKHYGEGELATIEQALAQGRLDLDAVVIQEQLVIYFNARSEEQLVAVYPKEGTLWEDHPLALLEQANLSPEARETFQALRQYLLSAEVQQAILSNGYRPADLSIPLDGPGSPLLPANGVDPKQPQTVLQMPSADVVSVVRDVWWYTKRHTNVYLVADTSGSMSGEKISKAQQALLAFIEAIRGDAERVGLVEFSSEVERIVPLQELAGNRTALEQAVAELTVGGDTALLDAIGVAYGQLQALADTERINAIVVMTDGRENASRTRLRQLVKRIGDGNRRGVQVYIFCIAYGSDADMNVLAAIAEASGGQVRQGDLTSIEELYKIISTYF